ncbi:long-chain fatty acid transport protein [Zhongshania antarctica]|uniref:Long-chain fatty acid transport protein n=1 Tax=Zhongshania antarctica TaxID=641702 RepID=A0A840RAB3_9GAMM|nr:long-chain fatty acid transport protein [Zhongshania antarctica]
MSGTDMAFSSNPTGINNNPAGIAKTKSSQLEFTLESHRLIGTRHKDSLGNDVRTEHDKAYLINGGWLTPLNKYPNLTAGIGLFVQGGAGFKYSGLLTETGERDDISALFGVFRIAPALAYKATDTLRLGLSVSVNYTEANQEVFPNISNAEFGLFGAEIINASGLSYSWRAGLQYDLSPAITVGLAYGASTKMKLENGEAIINFEDLGFGRVNYADASIKGLSLPEEIGLGISWQVTPQLNLGADINLYAWKDALGKVQTHFSRPQQPTPMAEINIENDLSGKNNFSKSVAAIYQINDANIIYTGLSHVGSAVNASGLSPLNNFTAKWHYSIGYEHKFNPRWKGFVSYTYSPANSRSYSDKQLPLGNESEASFSYYSMIFTMRYAW